MTGISWDWNPNQPLAFVDFETTSTANLKKVGSHAYVRHGSTRLLSAVFQCGSQRIVWCPGLTLPVPDVLTSRDVPQEITALVSTHTWVAHNAEGFDAMLWDRLYPDIRPRWLDTMHLCRVMGLPAGLESAAKALGLAGAKDAEGQRVMRLMSTRPDAVGTVPLWEKLLKYNAKDVEILAALHGRLASGPQDVLTLHSAINERGVLVDRSLASQLLSTWDRVKLAARDEIAEATGGKLTSKTCSSGPAVHKWLASLGVAVKSLRRDYLASILSDPGSLNAGDDATAALVAHVLTLRGDVVRTGERKVSRLLDTLDSDDRLRRMLVFHGAGTGRFSSRVVQVHNLPRGVDDVDVEALVASPLTPDAVTRASAESRRSVSDVLGTLVRPCFVARPGHSLVVADFASVEARCVAWMAGEEGLLKLFASGGDSYCDMASSIYRREITKSDKVERQVGKTLILGAMYGLGAGGFLQTCKNARVNLEVAGAPYRGEYDADTSRSAFDARGEKKPFALWFADRCIKSYRNRYPAIQAMWRRLIDAMMSVVRTGVPATEARSHFATRGLDLVMTLPSGREIVYREVRVEKRVPRWAMLQGRPDVPPVDCLDYSHPHGYAKEIWHGLATENCLGAETRVVTDRGVIPITDVTPNHYVWDGEAWVKTEGVIYKGTQRVGTWLGVTSTADHLIKGSGNSWRSAIASDALYLQQSLLLARDSMILQSPPIRSSVARESETTLSCYSVSAVTCEPSQNGHCYGIRSSRVCDANIESDLLVMTANVRFGIRGSDIYGLIGTQGLSLGVTTPHVELTITTVGVVFAWPTSGYGIATHFTDTQRPFPAGMIPCSILTDAITTGTTSRATCDLYHGSSTRITSGPVYDFDTSDVSTRSLSSDVPTVQRGMEMPSRTISIEDVVSRGLWRDTGRREEVYDLLNCGPRSRFTIITDAGPIVVHNCSQAICRDLLVDAMLRYEALRPGEIVLHVHDEVVLEASDPLTSLHALCRVMSTPPAWAAGFPQEVEAHTGPRYVKSPFRDAIKAHYRGGVEV